MERIKTDILIIGAGSGSLSMAAGAYFSSRLIESPWVKRVVGLVQKWLP
ncbi:MAG: hypothetical protein AAF198_08270 [Pseudomonadota bacterium]